MPILFFTGRDLVRTLCRDRPLQNPFKVFFLPRERPIQNTFTVKAWLLYKLVSLRSLYRLIVALFGFYSRSLLTL